MSRSSVSMLSDRIVEKSSQHLNTTIGRLLIVGFLGVLVAPMLVGTYRMDVLTQALVFIVAVTSWNLVAGYFGILSFAHAALFGVGGYAGAIFAAEVGLPPFLGILLAGAVTGLLSFPISLSLLHLSGAYIAMITLAFGQMIYFASIIMRDVTGGPTGYTGYAPLFGGDRILLFYFVLAVVLLLLAVQYIIAISRIGLVARAIRESEDAAQMLGNDTRKYKIMGFVIGSSLVGIAGGLQAYNVLIISPPTLALNQMIEFMAMSVVGGIRSLSGGIIGVIIVFGLSEGLRELGTARLLVWGILLVVAILYFPNGVSGADEQLRAGRDWLRSLLDR